MTLRKLASLIAKREGKKVQARIGEIREVLRIIVELEAETYAKDFPPEQPGPFDVLGEAVRKENNKRQSARKRRG